MTGTLAAGAILVRDARCWPHEIISKEMMTAIKRSVPFPRVRITEFRRRNRASGCKEEDRVRG